MLAHHFLPRRFIHHFGFIDEHVGDLVDDGIPPAGCGVGGDEPVAVVDEGGLGFGADENFEKLGIIPMLFLTPLTFLGGTFYSIDMLPEPWDTIALANPIVYLVSGLRWTFYGSSDVNIWISFGITLAFLAACVGVIAYIFKTGWRLRA